MVDALATGWVSVAVQSCLDFVHWSSILIYETAEEVPEVQHREGCCAAVIMYLKRDEGGNHVSKYAVHQEASELRMRDVVLTRYDIRGLNTLEES